MRDWGERQHTSIAIALQCALAKIKQLAYIAVVQSIGVLALFPKCLVAGLGKIRSVRKENGFLKTTDNLIKKNSITLHFDFESSSRYASRTSASLGEGDSFIALRFGTYEVFY